MLKLLLPFVLLCAVLGFVVLSDEPSKPADFAFINRGDVSTLDLQRMSWMQDLRVARLLFEGLVRKDIFSHAYSPIPGVAERWDLSPDGRTYTFHLRPDAKWTNGSPVTAHDFVYSWRRGLLPDLVSDYAGQFQLIEGGHEFYNWRERALRGMGLRGNVQRASAGTLFADTGTVEERARTLADVIWFFHEARPVADAPGDDSLASARVTLDSSLSEIARLRTAAASAADNERAPIQESIEKLSRAISDQVAALAPRIGELRTLVDDGGITGATLWGETEAAFTRLVQLSATSDRELRVTLVRPTPYFLDLCGFAVFYPVYPPLVRAYEHPDLVTGRLDLESGWTKPPLLVSNGPFELKVWRFKRDMRLEKNQHYWNKSAINLDSIAIPSVEDPNAQVLSFDSGGVDWVSDVSPSYRGDIVAAKLAFYAEHQAKVDQMVRDGLDPVEIDRNLPPDPRKRIHAFQAFGTYFYNFNCRPMLPDGRVNPFADARVRRAFAMSIDKRRIAVDVRRVGERPTSVLIPRDSIAAYTSPKGLSFDPAAARALLAEAGYPDGKGMLAVEILYNKDAGHDVIAQAAARDWQEHLNVRVILAQKEIKVFRQDLKNHNFMISRAGWYGDYGDPTTFLEINRTGDGNNDRDYSSRRFDSLLDLAGRETDSARRMAHLTEAERVLVEEDLPLIPIFQYVQVYLFDPDRITGISSHPRQEQNLYLVDVLGDGKGAEKPILLPARPPRDAAPQRGGNQ